MKKILVPCDFSKPAINAFRFALDVASQSRGIIHLLHVIELPVLHDTMMMPVLNFEEVLLKELSEKAQSQFYKIMKKYKADGVKVISEVQFGAVSRMIQRYIEKESIDLVLMGSHGASGVREFFIGSNAEKVVRNSSVPVLVMKEYNKGRVMDIVFPNALDTENHKDLVMKVKGLQSFFKATLHIVWINTPANFVRDTVTLKRLNDFAVKHALKNFTVNIFNDIDSEEGIIHFSNLTGAQMVAMGTHGRIGLGRLFTNSIAEDVINHIKCPVWTYSLKNKRAKA